MPDQPNFLTRYWHMLRKPGAVSMGFVLAFGFTGGIIFWGGFNTVLEATNTEEFCIGCHSMNDNVYVEYQNSIHYSNRSGVRAICADCHVPHEWAAKMVAKVKAAKDVWGEIIGRVDTREKFEAYRLTMAKREWAKFRANDSLACRNCHDESYFDLAQQDQRSAYAHDYMIKQGGFTCIDCHKGIAHNIPKIEDHDTLDPAKLVAEAEARRASVRSYDYDK